MTAVIQLLLLLLIANGAPIIAHNLLGHCWSRPLDGGRLFPDGRPWLGPTKTIRGIIASLALTPLAAAVVGLPTFIGLQVAAAAMVGDLASSFLKRRLGIAPSNMALGLDQIPEALFPALLVRGQLGISFAGTAGVVAVFLVLGLVLSRLLFALNIRRRPF
ncbi:MAG: CDP-archaeol synthase [Gammaproteobacteria bacterium]|jgi:CDP-2,3-bis-(O-geranylgeranyl)-sn-glycerol synthase